MTELEKRAKEGDQQAFAQLVEEHQKRVYNLALRMVKNPADAEEVVQEAFVNAWRGLACFKGESSFATWMHRLTTNACIDFLRREKNRRQMDQRPLEDENTGGQLDVPDQSPTPQQRLERRERVQMLREALRQLSEEHRQVLELRAMDGLSYEEIGQLLDLPPGTVKSRLARGRLALKKLLVQTGNFSEFLPSIETDTEKGGIQR